ncbi:MAG: methyltransferase domain-containing protein [Methanomassiliicoccus sp.]|nr:methyltransferase domain-containing protein [Methanomassiliicoccus sp.]
MAVTASDVSAEGVPYNYLNGLPFSNLEPGLSMTEEYVHGYSQREAQRLRDQATTLTDLLHYDTHYPEKSMVLEAGCGIGAQTVSLARNSPGAKITSMDISVSSIERAKCWVKGEGITNVEFMVADIFDLPFSDGSFDHIFICFVLEHLRNPIDALKQLKRVLRDGGTITIIEGDHGSAYFHPESKEACKAIDCLVRLQEMSGGNPKIGRQLFPLLAEAGFDHIEISPRMVYVDDSKPTWVEGFTKLTFTSMVEGVEEEALSNGMIGRDEWKKGISDLYRTAKPGGTFCYTFFKGVARKG